MKRSLVSAGHAIAAALNPLILVAICCGVLAAPTESTAQVVTPKTVPVLQAGQFDMFPSAQAGMGGAAIAVDDTLLDPFVNPAKARRIGVSHVFAAPFFHSVSGARGGGRSLPMGGGGSWGDWSATGLLTFQQLDRAGPIWNLSTSDRSAFNQYVAGSLARRLTPSTSIGFGLQLAALDAIDGVDLLYAGSDRIEQSGSLKDFRFGLTRETGAGRQLEVMLVHARTDMRHDVRFTTWRWDPVTQRTIQEQRMDLNQDRTNIWGVHSEYSRPVGSGGWRLGWLGTVNRLSHPKIPNYVIQNIPRDPGNTYSFNAGIGVSRSVARTTFAADLIYEPMFADTWADAANDTAVVGGGTIPAGGKTVENTFRFSNVKLRLGAGRDFIVRHDSSAIFGYQLGLGAYAINYRLQQANHVQRTFRTQREDWIEWSPTVGLRLRSLGLDVLYNFSLTCGPGACGEESDQVFFVPDGPIALAAGGIIAAPSGELFMQSGSLKIHKVTISLPIR
ncbi:MAG: hypothetical protein ABIS15_04365 [Gemmatimonadaceae bacterium]